jgi:hypothetical protein
LLQNLLEVRGIGLLDIRAIFGETAVRRKMRLKLIVHLVRRETLERDYDRLPHEPLTQDVLGIAVRKVVIQVVAVAVFCWYVVFRVMGRDYDAAVMSGGFTGFMLGTTANAMAVMHSVVQRYGPSPRAFLVAPIVGAFFIDFTNALLITGLLNLLS